MTNRRDLLAGGLASGLILSGTPFASTRAETQAKHNPKALKAMKMATTFMVETVATNGGYVWSYLPDMSRRWGELEAYPSMIWVQTPGTATMGHCFLDAYHATGDDYYYQSAEKVASALIAGQLDCGGWHYFIDFAGEASTRQWYDTIGKNAWRMEEFQHYWGNATFDDDGTSESMQFLLRLYVEKRDPKYRPALDKAIDFVLDSQYPIGGWPQRYPLKYEFSHHGLADYTSYITFNDDVTAQNVNFLIMCYQALGETRVLDAITRGMNIYILTQQGQPQPGWALQYTTDLQPAAARSYEPKAIVTHTTYSSIQQLMNFYKLTGETKYLARIPEALDWLDSMRLPDDMGEGARANRHPTFLEVGTNKPIYVHRRGSNVVNGEYYTDDKPDHTLGHYGSFRFLNVAKLRNTFETLKALPVAEATKDSPLRSGSAKPLPSYFLTQTDAGSDLNTAKATTVDTLVNGLNSQGYWPTPLVSTSHPYSKDGSPEVTAGDYRTTRVGDITDTSPFLAETPVIGISTGTYIENMSTLIKSLTP